MNPYKCIKAKKEIKTASKTKCFAKYVFKVDLIVTLWETASILETKLHFLCNFILSC